jgi:hypothetical protein
MAYQITDLTLCSLPKESSIMTATVRCSGSKLSPIPIALEGEVPLPVLPRLTVTQQPIATNGTDGAMLKEFIWDPMQMPFMVEKGKQLLVGWVNQVNEPVYTPLNITANGRGAASVARGMAGIVFVIITTQRYNSIDDLVLGTMAGSVVIPVSQH